jgi:thiosulfate dehydrogenase
MKFLPSAALFGMLFSAMISANAALDTRLEQSIRDGKQLYAHETFGGNGRTCETCHVNGGIGPGKTPDGKAIPSLANAAAIFPRFNAKANKVFTLQDQVRGCVNGALQGKPPAYDSDALTGLVSYVTSLSQGKPIEMGGKPE